MTNEKIIFNAAQDLMKQGIIKNTGRVLGYEEDKDGNRTMIYEPEAIHTYQCWKGLGYQVQKGQKAVAKFKIWKHTTRPVKEDEIPEGVNDATRAILEQPKENMFMVTSAFFSASQVEPITA